ncbi:hypothetical protein UY3_17438 [Chelonia mydas]|uniref:Uncharacterized protein n=1 Tax=Chelonia mydas TaxID=8469 RepID=M7AK40_CHEMY|nr:hypothetical protein UY3_17438 [Chelonia mydas]
MQSSSAEVTMQSSSAEVTMQSSSAEVTMQSSSAEVTMQSSSAEVTMQSSSAEVTMQSSSAEVTMMESQNRKRAPAWTEREGPCFERSLCPCPHHSHHRADIAYSPSIALPGYGAAYTAG